MPTDERPTRPDRAATPNIILISSDSMDGRLMGCAGRPEAWTPNLDRMAQRGARFANAYCNSPQCCPSRASMWSGKHIHTIGAWNNHTGLDPDTPTFVTELERAGYRSQVIGRTDHLSGAHSLRVRVNAWLSGARLPLAQRGRMTYEVLDSDAERVHERDWAHVDACVHWLEQSAYADERPFFLSLGVNSPHPAFRTSRAWLDRIDPAKVALPPPDEAPHPAMEFMAAAKNATGPSVEDVLAIRRIYAAMVAETDAMAGSVLEAVDRLGLAPSTYVIYISDHGEMNMEHGQHLKNALYEASARVPMIVCGPRVPGGLVVETPVSLVDLYPTLMDMAHAEKPEGLEGCSLKPLWRGQDGPRPGAVLSQYHSNFRYASAFMLRRGAWKYTAYAGAPPQIFDLDEDPDEVRDLAAARPDVVADMDAALREMVDYPAVADQVAEYDRESFRAWRAGLTDDAYQAAMREILAGWDPKYDATIQAWLDKG